MANMDFVGLYACVSVIELDPAVHWYTRLIGRDPDDHPMSGLVQWRNIGTAGIQIWEDREHAGHGRMTLVIRDMATERARLAEHGLMLEPDIIGDFGIIAQITDPAGNRVTLAEPPKGFVG